MEPTGIVLAPKYILSTHYSGPFGKAHALGFTCELYDPQVDGNALCQGLGDHKKTGIAGFRD